MNKPPKIRKKLIILIIIGLACAAGWAVFSPSADRTADTHATATVSRADIEETVTAQGKLEPKEYVDVGAQVSGQLQRVHVQIGDMVKKGQLMAEIDPKVYEAQVEVNEARLKSLNAQIEQQQVQLKLARQVYARNVGLIKLKAVSKEVVETTKANVDAATATLASLKAQAEEAVSSLKGAKANLSYTKIYAPISGTVTSQTTRQGQTINSNQTAPNIMQVANLDVMTVRAQVAEADVSRLTAGMDVYFTTLGSNEQRWHGTVRQILPTPVTINDVVLYEALVDVENTDHALMTGMSTQMFFVIAEAKNALVVPFSALRKPLPEQDTDIGKAYTIEVQGKGSSAPKTVMVGMMTRTQAEILSGVNEGDVVVLPLQNAPPAKQGAGGRMPMGPRL
jgi:membrane fusion protein, macrolide-specific efflux system